LKNPTSKQVEKISQQHLQTTNISPLELLALTAITQDKAT